MRRDPTSSTLELYDFRISLFENGEREEFLLFLSNFNTNLTSSGRMDTGVNIQYLRTLVHGEAFHHFDLLCDYVEMTETLNVECTIKGL